MMLWLLRQVFVVQVDTYQADDDLFPAVPVAAWTFALAAVLHADMNNYPFFDTLYMTSIFLSAISVLPQLCLTMRSGGCFEPLVCHHIAAMAVSRILSGISMWAAKDEITCEFAFVDGHNHSILAIFAAHVLHLLLLADFM